MKLRKAYILLAGLIMLTANGISFADSVYLGLSAGSSEVDTGVTGLTGTARLDEKDSSFKLLVGKNVSEFVSIEGFYIDYGEASVTGNSGDQFLIDGLILSFIVNNGKIAADATAIGVNALFSHKASESVSLYGKLGLVRWDSEFTVSGAGIGSASTSDTGTDPFLGVGLKVDLNTQFSLAFDIEKYEVDDDDVDVISVYLIYKLL